MKNDNRKRNKYLRNHPSVLVFNIFLPTKAFHLSGQGIQKQDFTLNCEITELKVKNDHSQEYRRKMYLLI